MAKTTKKTKVEEKETKKVPLETATPSENKPEEIVTKSKKTKKITAEVPSETVETKTSPTIEAKSASGGKTTKKHGKKYLEIKKKVDRNKLYTLKEAVKLVKETSISKFVGKVEAHFVVQTIGQIGEIVFPYLKLAGKKIVILNDEILKDIKDSKTNFDILITTPALMPKLLPFAKTLGPKGLMPNPKNGTLTDKPEESLKKLSVAKTVIKTEKKAPVAHLVIAKIDQPQSEIEANLQELFKIVGQKMKKISICATMGPGIKIEVLK